MITSARAEIPPTPPTVLYSNTELGTPVLTVPEGMIVGLVDLSLGLAVGVIEGRITGPSEGVTDG